MGEFSAVSMSPRENSRAMHIAKPSNPLSKTEVHMLRGIILDAFSISSAKKARSQIRDSYNRVHIQRQDLTHMACRIETLIYQHIDSQ